MDMHSIKVKFAYHRIRRTHSPLKADGSLWRLDTYPIFVLFSNFLKYNDNNFRRTTVYRLQKKLNIFYSFNRRKKFASVIESVSNVPKHEYFNLFEVRKCYFCVEKSSCSTSWRGKISVVAISISRTSNSCVRYSSIAGWKLFSVERK